MSISRKNWSALSSLARQWTMEDEEEVERERRRRVRSSSSAAEPAGDEPSPSPGATPGQDTSPGTDSAFDKSQGPSSVEQIQLDFVEILRVRDEKRRLRHVEMLRRQKDMEEGEAEEGRGGQRARVELLGDTEVEDEEVEERRQESPAETATKQPRVPVPTRLGSSGAAAPAAAVTTKKEHENGEFSGKDRNPKPPSSSSSRKFVSSVSISLENCTSPTERSGRTTPMSPCSPSGPFTPREPWSSPCHSPSPRGAQNPVQNGHTQEASVSSSAASNGSVNPENTQTTRPSLAKQSSRTASFRMLRKKEEDNLPLQRSFSVRMTSKKFEANAEPNQDEDKPSLFQRNAKQRVSSRSIQEKMERLAQAAQKSEVLKSPDVTQRTLFLLDEVSRKRGLFEREQQEPSPTSPGVSRQEFRSFTSGMSDRINRLLHKSNQPGSPHNPTDLRHVDISSRKSLFEARSEAELPGRAHK